MAPSSGFEPLTARLTAGCSDQLSYDGTVAPLFTPCLKASGTEQQRHRQFPTGVYNYKSSLAQPLQRVPTMTEIQEDRLLDCSGLSCPLPILKTKKTMDGMEGGEVLKMISTDPGSLNDVNAWTSRTSNPLLDATEDDGDYIFFIRKK